MRLVLGILAGMVVGAVTIAAIQFLSSWFHDVPADVVDYDADQMAKFVASLPLSALVMVWISDGVGTFIAAAITALIVPRKWRYPAACFVGAAFLAAGISNSLMIPHPVWFVVVDCLLYLPCALLGCWLVDFFSSDGVPLLSKAN